MGNVMKTTMHILRISAGKMEDNLYASVTIIDENVASTVSPDRIDVGQQHAKVRMDTDSNNKLALELANSGLVPGLVEVDVSTTVKQGEAILRITNFTNKKQHA